MYISNFKFQISNSRGFTLIELVVVLGLFMLIMGATVNMFISIVQHQKRILGQQEMLSQVSYAQEYVAGALQHAVVDIAGACLVRDGVSYKGYVYLLTRFDATTGFYQGIKFVSGGGVCREFFLDGQGLLKEVKGGAPAQQLLSKKFEIRYARFLINGDKNTRAAAGAPVSKISLAMSIQDASYENSSPMVIQTTISHR